MNSKTRLGSQLPPASCLILSGMHEKGTCLVTLAQLTGSPGQSPWHLEVVPRTEHFGWGRGTASWSQIKPVPCLRTLCISNEEP